MSKRVAGGEMGRGKALGEEIAQINNGPGVSRATLMIPSSRRGRTINLAGRSHSEEWHNIQIRSNEQFSGAAVLPAIACAPATPSLLESVTRAPESDPGSADSLLSNKAAHAP